MVRPLRRIPSLLACALFACGRTTASELSPIPSSTSRDEAGFRIDGDHVDTATVLAVGTTGESSWRLTFARSSLDCATLRTRYPEHAPSPDSLDVWLAAPLGVDGSASGWFVRGGYVNQASGGRGLVTRGAMVSDVLTTDSTVEPRGLEFALQEHGAGGRLFQFDGPLRATSCGRVARPEAPRPQPKLKLRVGREPLEIAGATLRPEGKRRFLRLTRAPHRCDSAFTEGYDAYIDVALDVEPPSLVHIALLGDAFPDGATGSKGKESFIVKAPGLNDGKGSVKLSLSGTIDAGGYVVVFDGEVDALRCTPAPK